MITGLPKDKYFYNHMANDKFDLLLELTRQINSNLDVDKVLREIINSAKIIAESEGCSVFLLDDVTDELILSIPTGPAEAYLSGKRMPKHEGIAGWVATNQQSQIINDVSKDTRFRGDFNTEKFITRNILCVPMLNHDKNVIGVLQALNKCGGADFTEEEIPLFEALANQAAIAINNARLNKERNTLIAEIHHRVKNNMAVVSSMMQMQAFQETNSEARKKLLSSVSRISSMASVHEQLYQSGSFSRLNFADNLQKIIAGTIEIVSSGKAIDTAFQTHPVSMSINQAIPCSLLINEVLTVIIKESLYNIENPRTDTELSESKQDGKVWITLKHNGSPVGHKFSTAGETTPEIQLISSLAGQLEADYKYVSDKKSNRFELSFIKSYKSGSGSNFF